MTVILSIFLIGFVILLLWFWIVSRTGLGGPPDDED
jgi:hypothetical protein